MTDAAETTRVVASMSGDGRMDGRCDELRAFWDGASEGEEEDDFLD